MMWLMVQSTYSVLHLIVYPWNVVSDGLLSLICEQFILFALYDPESLVLQDIPKNQKYVT
jgi:hypothetical protein